MNKIVYCIIFMMISGCEPYIPQNQSNEAYGINTTAMDDYVENSKNNGENSGYQDESRVAKYSDKFVDMTLSPVMGARYYDCFLLRVENKSNSNIKISWNDTYFIENGTANGGFMFSGVQYINRNAPKQDWMILSHTTSEKKIYPNEKIANMGYDRIAMNMGLPTGWVHGMLPHGESGAYIKMSGNNINKEIKLTIRLP